MTRLRKLLWFTPLFVLACASHEPIHRPSSATGAYLRHPMRMGRAPTSADEQQINTACDHQAWNERVTPDQQIIINSLFATRAHRLQHALWHAVRGGLNAQDSADVVHAFGSPWAEAHPLCPPPQNNPTSPAYNPAGEDFFYMHHRMVLSLRQALTANGKACVTGWAGVPDPRQWPVPDASPKGAKSNAALALLEQWDQQFQSATWLRGKSLSQVGWALEFTVHNYLHMRYASALPPRPFQRTQGANLPLVGNFPKGWAFDSPKYNWLADPYGAALNPYFWKIHGYVENILNRWLQANGYTRVSENCAGAKDCYEWHGLWVGDVPMLAGAQVTKAKRQLASQMKASDADSARQRDKAFNDARLAQQRLGVDESLDDESFRAPMPGTPTAPADPFAAAMQSLACP